MKQAILYVFFLTLHFSAVEGSNFDLESDEKIIECIHSDEFINTVIKYKFDGTIYPVTIVHNPNNETLFTSNKNCNNPVVLTDFIVGNLPLELARYLEELLVELWNRDDAKIQLRTTLNMVTVAGTLKPVSIADSIDFHDDEIRNVFTSDSFRNEVFYFHLNNEYYKVRILYNPKKENYSATKSYRLDWDIKSTSHTLFWNKKYGVLISKKGPKELIKHLSRLTNITWWDWLFGFHESNGTQVERIKISGDTTYTWSLDTWFDYTEELELKK